MKKDIVVRRVVIRLSTSLSKQTAQGKSLGCCEHKQNKIKFEPYGDLFDEAFLQHNENLINDQDPLNQNENDETPGAEYPK